MQEFTVATAARTDFVDITGEVREALRKLAVDDGAVVVFVPHTTAAVTINEGADPDVVRDLDAALNRLVPRDAGYRHAEGNADAHVKTTLVGSSEHLLVAGGKLQLGTWQKIWLCDFDGPRRRKVWVEGL
jgi:secondary thiamine-phosphate synthase enzyme